MLELKEANICECNKNQTEWNTIQQYLMKLIP